MLLHARLVFGQLPENGIFALIFEAAARISHR
jgi:hypothetical protein